MVAYEFFFFQTGVSISLLILLLCYFNFFFDIWVVYLGRMGTVFVFLLFGNRSPGKHVGVI